jgi:hypothetical protein
MLNEVSQEQNGNDRGGNFVKGSRICAPDEEPPKAAPAAGPITHKTPQLAVMNALVSFASAFTYVRHQRRIVVGRLVALGLHRGCGTVAPTVAREPRRARRLPISLRPRRPAFRLPEPSPTENAPPGRRGASGVTTGRRDMYLYICGSVGGRRALDVPRANRWESITPYGRRGAQPGSSLFYLSSVSRVDPLNQGTNIRAICV